MGVKLLLARILTFLVFSHFNIMNDGIIHVQMQVLVTQMSSGALQKKDIGNGITTMEHVHRLVLLKMDAR